MHQAAGSLYFQLNEYETTLFFYNYEHPKKGHLLILQNIHNFFQGPPNPGFRSVKVQTETFLKKDSRDLKNSIYLGFL